MPYQRRVVKRRPASLTDEEWLSLSERGKEPRPYFMPRDGRQVPAVDVWAMLYEKELVSLRRRLEVLCMALLKPSVSHANNGSSSVTVNPGQLLAPFSELWEFLTKPKYADGTTRITGHLSLKCSAGKLQVTLTDQTSGSYCCLTGDSLDDVFLALEIGLKQNSLPWRASGYTKGRK